MTEFSLDMTIGPGEERPTRWNANNHLSGLHGIVAALSPRQRADIRLVDGRGQTFQYIRWEQVRDLYIETGSIRMIYK
ncbi:MAG TPA: hypothetical protein VJB66_05640 [Candidatus Nanoarchaeia archaeon]|nr:hypothetical protein [Candidatus Nanoarchaeia archaeon]